MKEKDRNNLAHLVFMVLELAGEKFKDPSTGSPPSFMFSFLIGCDGIEKGYYLPILNHWGFTEYNSILWGMNELVLPWPHQDTFKWLTGSTPAPHQPLYIGSLGEWGAYVGGIRAGQIIIINDFNDPPYPAKTISGGTRQGADLVKNKMHRPWANYQLDHNPETCRFCGPMKGEKIQKKGNFRFFTNAFTPFKWHWLIVPTKEFMIATDPFGLYRLYSPKFISEALGLGEELAMKRPHADLPCEMGIHIGALAGQNMPHPHFAILQR